MQIGSNTATAPSVVAANAAVWEAMIPTISNISVTIASPPVVNFKVTDAAGLPVVGLGNTSKSDANKYATYPNLAFAIAKLVPGTNGSPSKWVSYIVTGAESAAGVVALSRPSTDNNGTLVDNGDGSYSYTFRRDITTVKDQVAALTAPAGSDKADLGDLTYTPTATHRVTIVLSGNAPGTGTNTPTGAPGPVPTGVPLKNPYDAIYDFIPATGQPAAATESRVIVANAKCEECHQKLGGIPGGTEGPGQAADFHGGTRNNVAYCVVCHTEQRKYGRAEATATTNGAIKTFSGRTYKLDGRAIGNLPNYIHKVHLGGHLAHQNYDYADVLLDKTHYPQDIRNCTKCHDGSDTSTAKTPQGDNWKSVPSRLACGSCHDGINFATGAGVKLRDAAKNPPVTSTDNAHEAGPQQDDSLCVLCHGPTNTTPPVNRIDLYHIPVTPPNTQSALHVAGGSANTNSAWIASNTSRLPEGAIKVSYEIDSVTVNASNQPVMKFRMLQNGARKDLNVVATTTANPLTGTKEIWDNFMGSPSVYFVFAVPQDGIAAPADFNASVSGYLRTLWSGDGAPAGSGTGAGTLTGPDANGFYTATLTGVTIPATAKMLTGGLGYSYNVTTALPLTQTNVVGYPVTPSPIGAANEVGGLIVITPNVQKVATNYTARRVIVEDKRCNACHQELGTFTEEAFHGGQRNDGTTCSWCHTPNRTSSAWSADSTSFVHAIHAANRRTVDYTWHAISPTEGFWQIGYPGILNKCEQCHVPGSYDFSAQASYDAVVNKQYRTVGQGVYNATAGTTTTTYSVVGGVCVAGTSAPQTDVGAFSLSPYITALQNYGIGFSYNAGLTTSNSCKPDGTLVANPAGGTVQADPTTLVTSPTATACFACHDFEQAKAHFEINGASIYRPRSEALAKTETCLVCHGPGRIADIKASHSK